MTLSLDQLPRLTAEGRDFRAPDGETHRGQMLAGLVGYVIFPQFMSALVILRARS